MTIFRCLDLETTGFPKDEGQENAAGIMEIGYCDLTHDHQTTDGELVDVIPPPQSHFVNCGIPVSIEARAVHHISDADVAPGMRPESAAMVLMDGPHEYFCAHNIDFEKKFFGGGERPWICTYKTALRIWPDAPGHKLMELRYHLSLDDAPDFSPAAAEPAHRAGADAYVCAHLLRRLLKEVGVEKMLRWSSGPALLYMCFMKKHKGKPWSQVAKEDPDYLDWIYNKSDVTDRDIRATVKYWLKKNPHET